MPHVIARWRRRTMRERRPRESFLPLSSRRPYEPLPRLRSPRHHLFSLFLLRPRVRLSPFMASFPPSLFLFPLPPPTFRPARLAASRVMSLCSLPLPSLFLSLCLSLSLPLAPAPSDVPPSRRPPPFQLDSLAAYPLSVVRRRSSCVFRDSYLCLAPVDSLLLRYPAVATSSLGRERTSFVVRSRESALVDRKFNASEIVTVM